MRETALVAAEREVVVDQHALIHCATGDGPDDDEPLPPQLTVEFGEDAVHAPPAKFGDGLDRGAGEQRLSIEAGYQYWGLDSGEGDKFTRAPGGTTRDKLLKISIERYGPYVGLQYRF